MRAQFRIAMVAGAMLLAACGGGSSSNSVPAVGATGARGGNGELNVKMSIPVPQTGSLRPHFIVAQTNGIEVALSPQGATQPTIDIAYDVSPTSALCSTNGSTRTCTLAMPAVGGTTYAVRFASFDAAPLSGTIPSAAKQLALGVTTATIVAGQLNTLSVALNGTPSSVVVPFSAHSILAGAPSTLALSAANVLDAAGNIIVGAYASPVSVTVTDTGAHVVLSIDGGVTKSSIVNLTSSTDASTLTAYYDGAGSAGYAAALTFSGTGIAPETSTLNRFSVTPAQAAFSAPAQHLLLTATETSFSGAFSVKSSSCGGIAAVSSTSPTFGLTSSSFGACVVTITDGMTDAAINVAANVTQGGGFVPPPSGSVTEYVDATANLVPTAVTPGSDGNVWFVGHNGVNGFISRVTPSGTIADFVLPANDPVAVASGADGNLWVVDATANNVTVVNTSGAVVATHAVGSSPFSIALGSEGAMWITNDGAGTLTCITSAGATHTYALANATAPTGIAAGADGAMWALDFTAPSVQRIATPCGGSGGGAETQYPIPSAAGSAAIVSGPDGALWFTETIADTIGRITTTGGYSDLGALAHAPADSIVKGPDLNLWYSACSCIGTIERVTPAGTITPFTSGITAVDIIAVSVGADGGIWYVGENGGATATIVGRLQP